jgi:transcriptional regulator with XRE-family HTH domain/energy-coupling factor transporter ATP-binding protein EcfA2
LYKLRAGFSAAHFHPEGQRAERHAKINKGKSTPMKEEDPAAPIKPDWIRQERLRQNWSQSSLAEKLGTTRITVNRWENGSTYPNLYFRHQLYTLFGLPPAKEAKEVPTQNETDVDVYNIDIHVKNESGNTEIPQADIQHQTLPLSISDSALPVRQKRIVPDQTPINRQRLLLKVREHWINGVLELSLHNILRIELEIHETVDALTDRSTYASTEGEATSYKHPIDLIDAYDEAGGQLLLLGETGSGKTTLLLELARDLLHRAEQDTEHPIPVIFQLASWAEQPLDQWLVDTLVNTYQVTNELALEWIEQRAILPLFDGLDELPLAHYVSCIEAIDTYQHQYGLHLLVVCSRSQDYLRQPHRLMFQRTVTVQPLTRQQVISSLADQGEQFSSLCEVLSNDPNVEKSVATPLVFQTLIRTYQAGKLTSSSPQVALSKLAEGRAQKFSWQHLFNRRSIILRVEVALLIFITIGCLYTLAFLLTSLKDVSITTSTQTNAIARPIGSGECHKAGYFELFFSNRAPICYANAGIVIVDYSHVIEITSGDNHGQFDIDGHPQSIGYWETQTFPSGIHVTRIQIY